ncbi:MAG: hypothetical protein U0800_22995 [Isosphaeraceae bacterium]
MILAPPEIPEEAETPSKSRENAVRHGFTGEGVVLPASIRGQLQDLMASYTKLYHPRNQDDRDLVYRAALGLVRFESIQAALHDRQALRAEQAVGDWELLSLLDAHEKARALARRPDLS